MSTTMDWPTKPEAAQALGVSTKTLEKYVQAGRLEQQMQSRVNAPPRAVINPDSLQRLISERSSLPTVVRPQNLTQNIPETFSEDRAEKFLEAFSEPRTSWPVPLWLDEAGAVRYSGLGIGYLRGAVTWRKIGPRGSLVCKRADLDGL